VSAGGFFREHVLHNAGLKITSLLLAFALWLAVASSPESQVNLNVPIIFLRMPSALEISTENIPSAQVRVRGPERLVSRLQASDLRLEIDLTGLQPGEHTFDLTKDVAVPDRLEVAQIVPSELHLSFDTRARRQIPVHPRVVGTPAPGYRVGQIESDPPAVEIMGPKELVESIESAITEPVDVSGASRTITIRHTAYVSDPLIQVSDPHGVRVTVTIQKGNSSLSK
jgi:YbbR domain-containing protein